MTFFRFAVSANTTAQHQARKKCESEKFVLQLLPGYQADLGWGVDSWGATISKDGGVTTELFQGASRRSGG